MVGRRIFCAAFAVMVVGSGTCWGSKKKEYSPAEVAEKLSRVSDFYIFGSNRGQNVEQQWFDNLGLFFKSIDSSIAKMPKSGLSKLGKDNKDLIDGAKQFVLEFSTKFFSALRGNAGAVQGVRASYPKIKNISESLKIKTGTLGIGADSERTQEIKKSLQSVLGMLKNVHCHTVKTC